MESDSERGEVDNFGEIIFHNSPDLDSTGRELERITLEFGSRCRVELRKGGIVVCPNEIFQPLSFPDEPN